MTTDDDDAPPALSSLPDQVQAVYNTAGPARSEGSIEDEHLQVASTTFVGKMQKAENKVKKELKKGFFDAPKPKAKTTLTQKSSDVELTSLTARKDGLGRGGPVIPDFFRLEPDEETKRIEEMKGKIVSALKPTPDMISKLASNPDLLSGFEDPEVMAAVDEISKDPKKMMKYKDNKKVESFYKSMALFAGTQLEQLGNKPL